MIAVDVDVAGTTVVVVVATVTTVEAGIAAVASASEPEFEAHLCPSSLVGARAFYVYMLWCIQEILKNGRKGPVLRKI